MSIDDFGSFAFNAVNSVMWFICASRCLFWRVVLLTSTRFVVCDESFLSGAVYSELWFFSEPWRFCPSFGSLFSVEFDYWVRIIFDLWFCCNYRFFMNSMIFLVFDESFPIYGVYIKPWFFPYPCV